MSRDLHTNTEDDARRFERAHENHDAPRYAGVRSTEEMPTRGEAERDERGY